MSLEELPPIEDLQRAQQERRAALEAEREQARREAEEQAALQRASKEGLGKRQEAIDEMRALSLDAENMEAERIRERMERAEALTSTEGERKVELTRLQQELDETTAYLAQVEEIIAKDEDGVIDETVQRAKETAQAKQQELQRSVTQLTKHLEGIHAEQVSQEDVVRYKEIQERMEELGHAVEEIEQNPDVLRALFEQAEGQDAIRNIVIAEALRERGVSRQSPQGKFVELVSQRYLGEEFEARGINDIEKDDARLEAMRTLAVELSGGLHANTRLDNVTGGTKESRERWYSGAVLKNLIGAHASPQFLLHYLVPSKTGNPWRAEYSSPERAEAATQANKEAVNQALADHVGTINMGRAYAREIDPWRKVVPYRVEEWDGFDDAVEQDFRGPDCNYTAVRRGPILPKTGKAESGVGERIEREFEQDRVQAQHFEDQLIGEEIRNVEEEIAQRQQELKEAESGAEEREALLRLAGTADNLGRQLRSIRVEIQEHERKRERAETLLQDTTKRHFIQRGRYRGNIESEERQIQMLREQEADINRKFQDADAAREKLRAQGYGMGPRINEMERGVASLNVRLSELKQKQASRAKMAEKPS